MRGCAVTCWFFGFADEGGHLLHQEDRMGHPRRVGALDWKTLDGAYAPPKVGERQGAAALVHLDGYTVLAWWDRTGDRRFGSNSALIVDRECTLAEMLAEGARAFPAVMARQTVTPYVDGAR